MKYNLHWIMVVWLTFFGVSCSTLGNVPYSSPHVAPLHQMYVPLIASGKTEAPLSEVPTGDGFRTVFLFTDEANVADTLSWAGDSAWMGKFMLSLSVLVVISVIWGTIRAKGARKLTSFLGGVLFLIVWVGSSIHWVEIGEERQKEQQQEYQALLDIYNRQQYKIAEGQVEVLHTQPSEGHDTGDLLRIGGVELEVDAFLSTFGYRQTISHGGALAEGVYARVFYTGTTILRVDVTDEGD